MRSVTRLLRGREHALGRGLLVLRKLDCPSPAAARGARRRRARRRGCARSSRARRAVPTPTSRSTSGRNVRRSERSRRVATRAWWTPSGSTSSRTTGSCRIRRITESAIARRTTSPAVASAPRSATAISGRSGWATRARGCTSRSGRARPRRPGAAVRRARRGARGHLLADLDLELAEATEGPPPLITETASSTTPAISLPSVSCSPVRRRIVVIRTLLVEVLVTDEAAHELERSGRRACRRFPRRRSPGERGTARRALPEASRSSPRRAGAGGSRPSARGAGRRCRSTSCRCARAAPAARSARPGRRCSACGSRASRRASARVRDCAPRSSQRSALRFPSHRRAAPARANPAASSTERPRTPP